MKRQRKWLLVFAMLVAALAGMWRSQRSRVDPALVGAWHTRGAAREGEGIHDSYFLSEDGNWSFPHSEDFGLRIEIYSWSVSGDEVQLRCRWPLWLNQGDLQYKLSYVRFWTTRAWNSGRWLPDSWVTRFRREIDEHGEVVLVSIPDNPQSQPQRFDRDH